MESSDSFCGTASQPLQTPRLRAQPRVSVPADFCTRFLRTAVFLLAVALTTVAQAERIRDPRNGHLYEAVPAPQGLTWTVARARASAREFEGMQGHLATVTSEEENRFIATNLRTAARNGYWLGGFQLPGILDPAAGWQWVTGEPFGYANWNDIDIQQPNDSVGPGTSDDDQNAIHFWFSAGGRWNDINQQVPAPVGYVVEYEPEAFPGNPTITGYADPKARDVAKTSAPPGSLLRITGTNLGTSGTVVFSGIPLPAAVARWAPDEILVYVPTAPSYPFRARVVLVADRKRVEGEEFTIAPPASDLDNLLANGSFEVPDSSPSPVSWGYTYGLPLDPDPAFYRGAVIPGWRIPRGTIDVKYIYWEHAPDQGQQSIDLVGSPGAARIEQTFFTEPGRQYWFSGWIAHNPGIAAGRAQVYLNGELFKPLVHDVRSSTFRMNWEPFAFRFRATQEQTTLSIQDVGHSSLVHGTALDGLSVTLAPN
jgi:hypothetical protein